MKLFPLHLALFAFAVGVFAQCAPVEAQAYSADETALAVLITSEAGLSVNSNDGPMIGAVVMRHARWNGETIAAHIRRVYHRHTDPELQRRTWILRLTADPASGPDDRWHERLEEARAILAGHLPHGCSAYPDTWSRRGNPLDPRDECARRMAARRERMIASGRYVATNCGDTKNVPLARAA
jgi:hypothetical protein